MMEGDVLDLRKNSGDGRKNAGAVWVRRKRIMKTEMR
jgi:hypothetical protein